MKSRFVFLILLFVSSNVAMAAPPFSGTIFLDPDIIKSDDPTTYLDLEDAGQENRVMFDRRPGAFVTYNAFLFDAHYLDDFQIEIQVNPEFDTVETARDEALRFSLVIGRLPRALLRDVKTVWIHKGVNPFGGGNNNLLIHTGQADEYLEDGILEETLVHEASHTSLDADHADAPGWIAAQVADAEFITTYARDNSTREDIAETFLVWLAVRHRSDRISETLRQTIEVTTPNRIAYFDEQAFDLFPIVIPHKAPELRSYDFDVQTLRYKLKWESQLGRSYAVDRSSNLKDWHILRPDISSQGILTELDDSIPELPERVFFRVREEGIE